MNEYQYKRHKRRIEALDAKIIKLTTTNAKLTAQIRQLKDELAQTTRELNHERKLRWLTRY